MGLRNQIDPQAKYIFLNTKDLTFAFPIIHIDDDHIFFSTDQSKDLPDQIENGHIQSSQGILCFKNPEIDSLKRNLSNELGCRLHRLRLTEGELQKEERRRTPRHSLNSFLPIQFNYFGEVLTGQLVDISSGGMKVILGCPIKKNSRVHFEVLIPGDHPLQFKTDGFAVYVKDNKGKAEVGIQFISPEFESDLAKETYLKQKKSLENFLESVEK